MISDLVLIELTTVVIFHLINVNSETVRSCNETTYGAMKVLVSYHTYI